MPQNELHHQSCTDAFVASKLLVFFYFTPNPNFSFGVAGVRWGGGELFHQDSRPLLSLADPPEIELETDRVHSGENKEAHLTCLIHGNPTPTVSKDEEEGKSISGASSE